MVQRAMKFTPQTLLSAPRRSAGVPNASGTEVLYTTSSYSFESHTKDTELRLLDVESGASLRLAHNDNVTDLVWLQGHDFACLCAEKDGSTSLCIGDAGSSRDSDAGWKERHYAAGSIDAPAGDLKLAPLDTEGNEWAVVVSAQAAKDGSLFNSEKAKKTHSTGRLYSSLYVRHWDRWESKEKNALWYGKLSKSHHDGKYRLSKLTNALKDTGLECPIPPFGGSDNFDVSKDRIIFVAKDPDLNPALNVKTNVYLLNVKSWDSAGQPSPVKLTIPGFKGASTSPVFSPDGTKVAFLSMSRAGYEADRNEVFVLEDVNTQDNQPVRLSTTNASDDGDWDRSPSSICFSTDGQSILAIAEDYGLSKLFVLKIDLTGIKARALTDEGYASSCKPLQDGRVFVSGSSLVDNSLYSIVDPAKANHSDPVVSWTNSNSDHGNKFGLNPKQVSSIWTPASNPKILKETHSILVKPSNFDSSKKYPVAYIIHGGPQGSWGDNWSTRWNLAVFAEQGYIVVAPNPTGSTGYGQALTDAINKNWGGDPYNDIVKCFEWVGKNMEGADNSRAVALGASFGGYMMNWIQGHELGRKFKALVCHDGILSTAGMLATEELYFPFYDFGGTPWYDPHFNALDKHNSATQARRNFGAATFADWRRWDPAEHFDKWATPELVIHSSNDYRICISDGLAAFNVLQARGVESKFLSFPDENHFVLKPENSLVWHKVVLNWINHYAGLPPFTKEDEGDDWFWGGTREASEDVAEMPSQGKPET